MAAVQSGHTGELNDDQSSGESSAGSPLDEVTPDSAVARSRPRAISGPYSIIGTRRPPPCQWTVRGLNGDGPPTTNSESIRTSILRSPTLQFPSSKPVTTISSSVTSTTPSLRAQPVAFPQGIVPYHLVDVAVKLKPGRHDFMLQGKVGVVSDVKGKIATVRIKENSSNITIPHESLQPVTPLRSDTVKVIGGNEAMLGLIGTLVSTIEGDGVVQFTSNLRQRRRNPAQIPLSQLGRFAPKSRFPCSGSGAFFSGIVARGGGGESNSSSSSSSISTTISPTTTAPAKSTNSTASTSSGILFPLVFTSVPPSQTPISLGPFFSPSIRQTPLSDLTPSSLGQASASPFSVSRASSSFSMLSGLSHGPVFSSPSFQQAASRFPTMSLDAAFPFNQSSTSQTVTAAAALSRLTGLTASQEARTTNLSQPSTSASLSSRRIGSSRHSSLTSTSEQIAILSRFTGMTASQAEALSLSADLSQPSLINSNSEAISKYTNLTPTQLLALSRMGNQSSPLSGAALMAASRANSRTSLPDPLVTNKRKNRTGGLFGTDTTGNADIPDSTSFIERDSSVLAAGVRKRPMTFDSSSGLIASSSGRIASRMDSSRHSDPCGGKSLQDALRFLNQPEVAKVVARGGSGVGVPRVNGIASRGDGSVPGGSGTNGYSVSEILDKLVRNQRKFLYGLNSPTKPGSDIKTSCVCVSLICPLSQQRMKYPSRGKTCRHLQCFDAENYINFHNKMVRKKVKSVGHYSKPLLCKKWNCPICDKITHIPHLYIDMDLMKLVKDSDTIEVELGRDGSWAPVSKREQVDVIDLTDD